MLVFVVFQSKDQIGFVCHEMEALKQFIAKNKYYAVEIWNVQKGSRVAGTFPLPAHR